MAVPQFRGVLATLMAVPIFPMVAGFGGFLNRKADGMPGPQTIWIGLQRCKDFVLTLEAQAAAREFGCG